MIFDATPEERRGFIEEAAGVLKHRKRKEKAERRLDATEANLLRVQDLLREVRRQLRPLERQAKAAARHEELIAELTATGGEPAIDAVLAAGLGLKINTVVLPGVNEREIPAFVELTRHHDLTVRFIEPMPFDGAGKPLDETITGEEILLRLRGRYDLAPVPQEESAVDKVFSVRGFKGRIGVIEGDLETERVQFVGQARQHHRPHLLDRRWHQRRRDDLHRHPRRRQLGTRHRHLPWQLERQRLRHEIGRTSCRERE